jgi:6-phosphogluconolactonase
MTIIHKKSSPQISRWHTFSSAIELEKTVVEKILLSASISIKKLNAFHIVLAGGTTPRHVYELLKASESHWQAWHVYFGDERCLPVDHPERNSLMASLAWLNEVPIPAAQIHPIAAEQGARIGADNYAELLTQVKIFDLVLLGLGEDGHTASLFPDHLAGEQPNSPATLAVFDAPKPPAERVSLSAHRLGNAHEVIFLVTGKNKKEAIDHWRAGVAIPASAIKPANGVDIYLEHDLLS